MPLPPSPEPAGIVRTVCGDRPAADFAAVMVHEHLLFDIAPPGSGPDATDIGMENRWQADYLSNATPANARQTDVEAATAELVGLRADGGDLLVDQSVAGLARDPVGLRAAARASGCAVVAAAGTYTAPYLDAATLEADTDTLCARFVAEITEGMDGTGIRAGLIGEIGCSWPLEPVERKMIELAPDIFLPTPEDFQKQDEALRGAVKSFILPRREIERACNDSVNQLFEMYTNVLRRFVGMIQQGDERFELESTQSLVGYYLRIMGDQYRFLDEMCREYIPVSVMNQVDQINNTMNDVNSLLPILDDPNVMRAVSNVLRGFGSNASRLVQAAAARGLEGVEFVSSVIGAIVAFVFGRNPSLRLN